MTLLVKSEISGLFVKPLTAIAKFLHDNRGTLPQLIEMNLS